MNARCRRRAQYCELKQLCAERPACHRAVVDLVLCELVQHVRRASGCPLPDVPRCPRRRGTNVLYEILETVQEGLCVCVGMYGFRLATTLRDGRARSIRMP